MSDDKIISIGPIKSYDAKITLEESLKQDIADGLITPTAAGSIGPIEADDNGSYTIAIKKAKGSIIFEVPPEARARMENRKSLEDYFFVSPEKASELL